MQYESTFNAIDNILRQEAGCSNELDYIEQTSWLLFLKYLEDLETDMEDKADMEDFLRLQKTREESENSWLLDVSTLGEDCDLSVKNPNKVEEKDERTPAEILSEIMALHGECGEILERIKSLV